MLPHFPQFKRLSIRDQKDIDAIVHKFDPYSDFNFTSLLSWDYAKKTHISVLHNNLVITLSDYMSQEPRMTLIGKYNLVQSCKEIIDYALSHNTSPQLSLVPAMTVQKLKKDQKASGVYFAITPDEDNFDYIYTIQDLLALKGTKYHIKRKSIRRFREAHEEHTSLALLDSTAPDVKKELIHIFRDWQGIKHQSRLHIRNEFTAFKRLLRYAKKLPIQILGMYMHDKLCGFIVCEALPGKYGVMHFGKINTQATGSFEYLIYKAAELLHSQGCIYLNLQQDLNIENLRKTKLSWRPSGFLKKYSVSLAQKKP